MNYLSRSHLRTLDPNVFRVAAESIDKKEEIYSCCAVENVARVLVGSFDCYDYTDAWYSAFGPYSGDGREHPFWNKGLGWEVNVSRSTRARWRKNRVTSLLMMADIVQAARR